MQVGLVNDRVFLVNASLGLYPQLLEDREAWKRRLGRSRLVALAAALATLLRAHRRLRLASSTAAAPRDVRTPTLFVGNNRLQMEQIGIRSQAFDEGRAGGASCCARWATLGDALAGAARRARRARRRRQRERLRLRHADGAPPRGCCAGAASRSPPTARSCAWRAAVFRVSPEPLWLLKPDPAPPARAHDAAGQISDTHFGTERAPVVDALVRPSAALAPALVVLSGDITQRARRGAVPRRARVRRAAGAPATLAIPGNHDIPLFNLASRLFNPYASHRETFGPELEPSFESDRAARRQRQHDAALAARERRRLDGAGRARRARASSGATPRSCASS